MAAALAYYRIFSLPPLLVLLITLADLFLSPQAVETWIETQVSSVHRGTSEQIQTMVQNAQQRVQGGFSLGLILCADLLFGATGTFLQMQKVLNAAWEVESNPEHSGLMGTLTKRALSLGMILVIGAEFTQVWTRRHGTGIEPADSAVKVIEEKRYVHE